MHDKLGQELKIGDKVYVPSELIKNYLYGDAGLLEVELTDCIIGEHQCNSSLTFKVNVSNIYAHNVIKKPDGEVKA